MRKAWLFLCALVFTCIGEAYALPVTYSDSFPSAQSTINAAQVGEDYFFFSSAHSVSQPFQNTGIQNLNQIDLNLFISQNLLENNTTISWNLFANETNVGTWSWSSVNEGKQDTISFNFASIVGKGNYIIAMQVAQDIPTGFGSISLALDGRITLYGNSNENPDGAEPVPEPATILLFGAGIFGVAAMNRKFLKF